MNTTPPVVTTPVITTVSVGLDVSKESLDVCLLTQNKRHEKQFANNAAGHRQLLRWSYSIAKPQYLKTLQNHSLRYSMVLKLDSCFGVA